MSNLVKILVLAILIIALLCIFIFIVIPKGHEMSGRLSNDKKCQRNLDYLGGLISYSDNNQAIYSPFAENWCDILIQKDGAYLDPNIFICPVAQKGRSTYAMNKNIIGLKKIPDDIVVLFDSKPGWNQVGGHELLAPENHNGTGCYILFGHMFAEFVDINDLDKLRWKP